MESSLANIRLRWNLLRGVASAIAIATFTLTLSAIPVTIWFLWVLALLVGVVISIVALVKCDLAWGRLTVLAQGVLLAIALLSALSTGGPGENVPILLLAFVMILASEHILSLVSQYGVQFSTGNSALGMDFNVPILQRSLDRLYRRLAWDGAIFSTAYLLSVAIASVGEILNPITPALSDVSVYVLVTSIALAILIVSKTE